MQFFFITNQELAYLYHNIKTVNTDENRQSKTDPVGEVKGQPFAQLRLMNKCCKSGKKCICSSVFFDIIRCEISKYK